MWLYKGAFFSRYKCRAELAFSVHWHIGFDGEWSGKRKDASLSCAGLS